MMTTGSVRGNWTVSQPVQRRAQPARATTVAAPQRPQNRLPACQWIRPRAMPQVAASGPGRSASTSWWMSAGAPQSSTARASSAAEPAVALTVPSYRPVAELYPVSACSS